jgi:hypothetical protein
MRYDESLMDEEEMVHICEPKTGKNLRDDEQNRSLEDLMNCQKGRNETSDCQMGNGMVLLDDLRGCKVTSEEFSICQEGNKKRSRDDLKDCQEGRT